MNRGGNWYSSNVLLVIMFIFFWPAGVVMLYLRWKNKNGKYRTKTKILKITSGFLLAIGSIGLIEYMSSYDPEDLRIALWFFIAPGLICLFMGLKRGKLAKKYQKYVDYIVVRKTVEIEDLCSKFNVEFSIMMDIITDMIHKEFIYGYLQDNVLVVQLGDDIYVPHIDPPKKETIVIKCKECGAKNSVITGQKKECEYCGTVLQ